MQAEVMNAEINALIDAALVEKVTQQHPRNYLGGSRLGLKCQRQLWFEWQELKKAQQLAREEKPQPTTKFPGKTIRRFEFGHAQEDITAKWLKAAGFDLKTHDEDGAQFAFGEPDYAISGHLDGAIVDGPVSLPYPLLWEHKIAKASKWKEFQAKGLRAWNETYWGQVHVYMRWSELGACLFTVFNTDTSEIWTELVTYDEMEALRCLERGRQVIDATAPDMMPRIASKPDHFECKWCSFAAECWSVKKPAPVAAASEAPPWLVRKS
jgi:hypothetical protein